jgi:hypothetical protein
MNRPSDATWRAESGAKYRYCVDLVPPPEGFSDEVDEEIIEFVERCSGTFDLCGEITDRDCVHPLLLRAGRRRTGFSRSVCAGSRKSDLEKAHANLSPRLTGLLSDRRDASMSARGLAPSRAIRPPLSQSTARLRPLMPD